jgi:hypothetical protein
VTGPRSGAPPGEERTGPLTKDRPPAKDSGANLKSASTLAPGWLSDAEALPGKSLEDGRPVAGALRIADAWGPALNRSYELGWQDGYRRGRADEAAATAADWHQVWVKTRAVLAQPTHAELKARRGES